MNWKALLRSVLPRPKVVLVEGTIKHSDISLIVLADALKPYLDALDTVRFDVSIVCSECSFWHKDGITYCQHIPTGITKSSSLDDPNTNKLLAACSIAQTKEFQEWKKKQK